MELLKAHAPLFLFDSRETFFPCPIEFYISNADVMDKDGFCMIVPGEIGLENISSVPPSSVFSARDRECLNGFNTYEDLQNVPVYGTVIHGSNGHVLLQYVLFFPFRGSDYVAGCMPVYNSFEGQFKFVHVVLDNASNVKRVFFDGIEENFCETDFYDDHLIVYCGLGTHHMCTQSNIGNLSKYYGLWGTSHDEKGFSFEPRHIEYVDRYTPWIAFHGKWGFSESPLYLDPWELKFVTTQQ